MQKPRIKCESYKTWTDYGYEYDCGYHSRVCCEDCIITGGFLSPVTGKRFRGNRDLYPTIKYNEQEEREVKPMMIIPMPKAARKLKSTNNRMAGSLLTKE